MKSTRRYLLTILKRIAVFIPGLRKFIATESGLKLTTESGIPLSTEN